VFPAATPPASVCILRLSAIGDCCHVLPVVRTLQAAWPQTRISWAIGAAEASLFGGIDNIDFKVFAKGGKLISPQMACSFREPFDVLLHMQASWRANLLAWRIPARLKLGFDRGRARDGQWLFTQRAIAPQPRAHVMEGFFGFAEALGVTQRVLRWDIPLSEADRAFAREHLPDDRPVLLISPCSSARARNFRNWRAERYAEVASHAISRHGMRVVVTGGPTPLEADYGRHLESRLNRDAAKNLIGRTTLKQLLALIERATAVLCPDSGPAHLATTVGTAVIGLYASSNPLRTGPLDLRWSVNVYPEAVQAEFGKSVEEIRWGRRVRDPHVMDRIPVAAVLAKLDALMAVKAQK
jgi:heptosyltransferase I